METPYVLRMDNISKEYYGNRVLKNVNLEVKAGEIHALMGENGAGKSTLMNILFGMPVIHSTGGFEGTVEIDGKPAVIDAPQNAMNFGIGMVHQEFMLIPGFTITENIKVGREISHPSVMSRIFGKNLETLDMKRMAADARKALDDIGMDISEYVKVAGLPIGYMQFVEIAREIFSMYSEPQTSFGDIVRCLEERQVKKRDGNPFSRPRLRDLVVNPVYVKADYRIYEFFKAQGTNIINPPEDFIGTNGAYLYSGDEASKRKTVSLQGHTLVLAPHEGIIDAGTWIKCRSKCLNNSRVAKPVKAKATWLAGKIRCAQCGYALSAKTYHCKTKADNRYFLCTQKYNTGSCHFGSLNADFVEDTVFEEMKKKLAEFQTISKQQQESFDLQTIKLKSQIEKIDQEISGLLNKVAQANDSVMNYINIRVTALDAEK